MMLWELSAIDAAEKIRRGEITSLELVNACLERIADTDDGIHAWAFLDADLAREQAVAMDDLRRRGRPIGPLQGIPVGIKDLFDTRGMATAWGTRALTTRTPERDAAVIDKLREAGAVILGKTVTTEFAFAMTAVTRNPHNLEHTSGGSSAGSAAAVAAGHVPLAIASQTEGSTIRPASFCGVHGLKPTRGMISRRGCLRTSQTLDQVGVMGRTLEDVALLSDVLAGHDPADPTTYARPKPRMLEGCRAEVPVEPCFAWIDLPFADRLSSATRHGLEELLEAVGGRVERIPAPRSFQEVIGHHNVIQDYEFSRAIEGNPEIDLDQIDETLKETVERGRNTPERDYKQALAMRAGTESYFANFFMDYDAIIAPAALGEAPEHRAGTGDPICSTIWTFAGLPCLSLPWLTGETGLPTGVQLIGAAEEDDRLLRTAAWLERYLAMAEGSDT